MYLYKLLHFRRKLAFKSFAEISYKHMHTILCLHNLVSIGNILATSAEKSHVVSGGMCCGSLGCNSCSYTTTMCGHMTFASPSCLASSTALCFLKLVGDCCCQACFTIHSSNGCAEECMSCRRCSWLFQNASLFSLTLVHAGLREQNTLRN